MANVSATRRLSKKSRIGSAILKAITCFVLADIFILTFALFQISNGEQTGEWSAYWIWQAKIIVSIINL